MNKLPAGHDTAGSGYNKRSSEYREYPSCSASGGRERIYHQTYRLPLSFYKKDNAVFLSPYFNRKKLVLPAPIHTGMPDQQQVQ
jgi:hypothetical protein